MYKTFRVIGDVLYGVGIGVIANVAYSFSSTQELSIYSLVLSLYLIFIGALIKEY